MSSFRRNREIINRWYPELVVDVLLEKVSSILFSSTCKKADTSAESVNTDPVVSPVKAKKGPANEKIAELKEKVKRDPRERTRFREQRHITEKTVPSEHHREPAITAIDPRPTTPAQADLNLFSPLLTEPSAVRPESRDTPPPSDLESKNQAARTTRRPKASISYAEPSLRDKMRRPTKELVDAVVADERVHRAISAKPESGMSEAEDIIFTGAVTAQADTKTVTIKKERGISDATNWKLLPSASGEDMVKEQEAMKKIDRLEPTSPLGEKKSRSTISAGLPPSILTERKRRTLANAPDDEIPKAQRTNSINPGAGTVIATLMAGGNTHKRNQNHIQSQQGKTSAGHTDTKTKDPSDIYDFHGSSPTEIGNKIEPSLHSKSDGSRKATRRISSVPDSLRKVSSDLPVSQDGMPGTQDITSSRPRSSASASSRSTRRRDTLSTSFGRNGQEEDAMLVKAAGIGLDDLIDGESLPVDPLKKGLITSESLRRADRAASRRKSMMI